MTVSIVTLVALGEIAAAAVAGWLGMRWLAAAHIAKEVDEPIAAAIELAEVDLLPVLLPPASWLEEARWREWMS